MISNCTVSCHPIRPSIPRRTESARDIWPNLPRIRVIEMWLIGELAARNIGGMTTAPRGGILLSSLLSLAPLYNSRHHHRDARPPGIPPACVSLHSAPSPRRARTLIFGSVLTRLPAATTDVSLDSSPPTTAENFFLGRIGKTPQLDQSLSGYVTSFATFVGGGATALAAATAATAAATTMSNRRPLPPSSSLPLYLSAASRARSVALKLLAGRRTPRNW